MARKKKSMLNSKNTTSLCLPQEAYVSLELLFLPQHRFLSIKQSNRPEEYPMLLFSVLQSAVLVADRTEGSIKRTDLLKLYVSELRCGA